MATADIDQKVLGHLARAAKFTNPILESGLYTILGLSTRLSRQLLRARKLRRLDTSRDTKSLDLYIHILFNSREGLRILEAMVLPFVGNKELSAEYQVITAKLIASFYHAICLFNNSPPISQAKVPMYTNSGELMMAMAQSTMSPSTRSASRTSEAGSTTPTQTHATSLGVKGYLSPGSVANGALRAPRNGNGNGGGSRTPPRRAPFLRDPTNSIQSDSSFVTNPYANTTPLKLPQQNPPTATPKPAPPPGLGNAATPALILPPISPIPHPAGFIMPAQDYLPLTKAHFQSAQQTATQLPSNHPLRLSVALEHAAFTWDCLHDSEGARRIARKAVREILQSREGMSDTDFQDAQALVAALGAVMRRKSGDDKGGSKVSVGTETERKSSGGTNGEKKKQRNGKK